MSHKYFFIADTHFGHANIIKFAKRPFDDVYEMDEALVANWNETVRPADTVFVLGDVRITPHDLAPSLKILGFKIERIK